MAAMGSGIETGFQLDRRWHVMRSEPESSKKPTLLLLGRVLAEARVAYAIIGGIALQAHQEEPRTTLDIDLAVLDRAEIPCEQLETAGFRPTGRFPHSENWVGPDGTPVRFTDAPALSGPVARAEQIEIAGLALRVIRRADLLHEELRAASDPARRRSKRLQDLADAHALLESDPALAAELSSAEQATLGRFP